ncbi:MAG: hypothetical protein SOY83_03725 [Anaerovoracaceae bacterium]|nr:hypothetical protein [Bacillota bacterium]MDY3954575.1 hypothetical protein [Anaerovoracaceae bacterium]
MAFDFEKYLGQKLFGSEKGKVKSELCRFLTLKPTETHEKVNRVLTTRNLPYYLEVKKETEGEHENEVYMKILPKE